jgi:predicted aspartyl protease
MRTLITVAALIALAPASFTAVSTPSSVPFRLTSRSDIVVPATVDGQGPFQFLVDTGSSRSVISTELTSRLGLPAVAHTLMVTPSGTALRPITAGRALAIGTAPPATVHAVMLPRRQLSREPEIDGLIGQDVLATLTYTIDYEHQQLLCPDPNQQADPARRLLLTFDEGRLLVALPQGISKGRRPGKGETQSLQLIPDTGADGFVFFARRGRMLPSVTPLDTAALRTPAGQKVVRRVLIDVLDVGDIRLQNQFGTMVDYDESDRVLGDGLLPLHLFARVSFNGPEGYLIVKGIRD